MDTIKLVRIDFRLIHGQVITNWVKQVSADQILVIDRELTDDPFMAQVYLMAAPPNVKVHMVKPEDALEKIKDKRFKSSRWLVLFKSVPKAKEAFDLGFPIKELQIGGLGNGSDKVMISNQLSLNEEEVHMLQEMEDKGTKIYLQSVSKEAAIPFKKAAQKVLKK